MTCKKNMLILALLTANASLLNAEELPNPHQERILKQSSDYGEISAGFKASTGIYYNGAKEPGGYEASYFESWLNPAIDYTYALGDSQQIGVSWNFIVPESTLIDGKPNENRLSIKGDLARPQHLIYGYYQKAIQNGILEISLGQELFAGFTPLANITDYSFAYPALLMHTWQYDQGLSVSFKDFTQDHRELYSAKASIINGDGGFAMSNTTTKSFSNSYPGYALTAKLHPLTLIGVSESFTNTYGDLAFLASFVKADRGSYPLAKRPANHILLGLEYTKKLFGYNLALRGLIGELQRGLTDYPIEKSCGWTLEAAINEIPLGKSKLTPYAFLSNLKYQSGAKNELWLQDTSYQNQWGAGLRLDTPFGLKHTYLSGGAVFNTLDGKESWVILNNANIYFLEAGIALK